MGCRARADAEQLYAIPIVAALIAAALESALEVRGVERNAPEI
jgi:hypothetical protein